MTTVGASCEVHLMLRGMVDVGKEVSRLDDKIEKLNAQIAKVKKMMDIENYEEKVCVCTCVWFVVVGGVVGRERERERERESRATHSLWGMIILISITRS